jgi:transposase
MAHGRIHSREFKLDIVRQVASGENRWRKEYDARGEAAFGAAGESGSPNQERRIAELERLCGQLALENAALKRGLSLCRSRSSTR